MFIRKRDPLLFYSIIGLRNTASHARNGIGVSSNGDGRPYCILEILRFEETDDRFRDTVWTGLFEDTIRFLKVTDLLDGTGEIVVESTEQLKLDVRL